MWEPESLGSGVGRLVRLEMREPDKVRVMSWAEVRGRRFVALTVFEEEGVHGTDGLVLCRKLSQMSYEAVNYCYARRGCKQTSRSDSNTPFDGAAAFEPSDLLS